VTTRPPRFAERLVTWSLFPADREAVLGDLQEEFAAVADKNGADTAWRWYWTQTLASIGPNVLRRVRGSYELRRLTESDSDRMMRKSMRTFSLWLIGVPIAVCVSLFWAADDLPIIFFLGLFAVLVGVMLLLANLLPHKAIDRETAAVNRQKNNVLVAIVVLNGCLRLLIAQRYRYLVTDPAFLLMAASLLWPKRYWPIRPRYLGPDIPQAPTPFVIGAGADGPIFLTVDVPQQPAKVGNLILARARDARIVIDRVFAERDGLRLFAIVISGAPATIQLFDDANHVVRRLSATLERTAWSSDDARQIDITVPLDQLAAGSYRVRVSVNDAQDAGAREAAFRIRA
jgi:hypothetical protein